jgi:hypothetical protein
LATSSTTSCILRAAACISFARLLPGIAAQAGNALRAASTAASTSAVVPRGI